MSYRAKDSRPSAASSSQASYLSASSTATTSSFSNFFSSIAKTVTGQSKVFPQPAALVKKAPLTGLDPAKEPIKSYLRFRPRPNDPNKAAAAPYIETLSDTEVSLTAPEDASNTASTYKFTRVFDDQTDQVAFFQQTTLPLVKDVLTGSSGLLFAYGVSNSGKTYTIQGGDKPSEAGLLPRTLDVIFNSIEGMHSMCNFQPSRLTGVEASKPNNSPLPSPTISSNPSTPRPSLPSSTDHIPLSNLYEYAIWVSYAEIYNEKIYDLLEDSTLPQINFSSGSLASVGLGRATTLKRKALALKQDKLASHKYVHGLKEIRVFSAEEARSVLRKGQNSRRVYSTLLNRASSRSHGCFTIKIIRNLKDCDPRDIAAASVSRLNIVDLAGSERSSNTGSTGERLKEAGNINKSLMVLGQCMEVLRRNQVEKEKGRKPALVPYRHSKVTELFQSFFAGEGKAAMIVNVNPFDTGFEENTHVMRFSAVAKDITTTRSNVQAMTATPKRAPPPTRVSVTSSDDTVLDITIEEDDDALSEEEEEDELVNYLFEENRTLRAELVDYKIRLAMVAEDVRSSLFDQFDGKMREMEQEADRRVAQAIEALESKMNKKIDILNQAHQYELELLADSGLSDLETIPDEDQPTTSDSPITPVRDVAVEVPRQAPAGRYPSVEATPNGKHAQVVPIGETVSISSDEDEIFVKPARPVKAKTSQPPRRSTRASSSRTTATIPKAKPKAITKPPRPSPIITLTEEGDEDQSIIISAPKVKKKMKLRTKASAPEEELEALQDDVSFVVPAQKASRK